MIDIIEIKKELNKGRLKVDICGSNILLQDTQTGEAIKICELMISHRIKEVL